MCWWSPRAGGDVMREIGDSGRCNGGPAAPREHGGGVGGGPGDAGGGVQPLGGGEDPEETTPLTLLAGDPPDKDLTDINSLLDDIHKLGGRGDSIPLRSLTPGPEREATPHRHTPVSQARPSRSRKTSVSSGDDIIEVEQSTAAQVRRPRPPSGPGAGRLAQAADGLPFCCREALPSRCLTKGRVEGKQLMNKYNKEE